MINLKELPPCPQCNGIGYCYQNQNTFTPSGKQCDCCNGKGYVKPL
jgi:DnaJ-class molecular chaperone